MLSTFEVRARREEFARRARTWEDRVAIPGFFIFCGAAGVSMWVTRQQPGLQPVLLPMILFGAAISWGAFGIGALMALERVSQRGATAKGLLALAVAAVWSVTYWSWTRLHLWCGAACPACGEELVGGKGEPAAGIAERTKSCPGCGASVVSRGRSAQRDHVDDF